MRSLNLEGATNNRAHKRDMQNQLKHYKAFNSELANRMAHTCIEIVSEYFLTSDHSDLSPNLVTVTKIGKFGGSISGHFSSASPRDNDFENIALRSFKNCLQLRIFVNLRTENYSCQMNKINQLKVRPARRAYPPNRFELQNWHKMSKRE